ncbi:MAG: S8 family serine peptidase [Proteobacteria bacterium]|nr:S8 family serine peptidase [Pseudomonadota bacterium]
MDVKVVPQKKDEQGPAEKVAPKQEQPAIKMPEPYLASGTFVDKEGKSIKVALKADGSFIRTDDPDNTLGELRIEKNNIELEDGMVLDILSDPKLKLEFNRELIEEKSKNRFNEISRCLKNRLLAEANNEVKIIQQEIHQKLKDGAGEFITGKGRSVLQIEQGISDDAKLLDEHARLVRSVVKDEKYGIAPDVEFRSLPYSPGALGHPDPLYFEGISGDPLARIQLGKSDTKALSEVVDSAENLNKMLLASATRVTKGLNERISQILQSEEFPDAINVSMGISKIQLISVMYNYLDNGFISTRDNQHIYSFPKMREAVYGDKSSQISREDALRKVATYIDKQLAGESSVFQSVQQEYRENIKKLTERGTAIIVASGNERTHYLLKNFPREQHAELTQNFLCLSEDVFSVGAVDPQLTTGVGKRSDDKLTDFSSRGKAGFEIDIAAPGEHILGRRYSQYQPHNIAVSGGTSFAAPYVAGVFALVRQANPDLSVRDIFTIMNSTATINSENVRIINPELVVEAALKRRK